MPKTTDVNQSWYKDGVLHRLDGPARIEQNSAKYWYHANGTKYWYQNGKRFTAAGLGGSTVAEPINKENSKIEEIKMAGVNSMSDMSNSMDSGTLAADPKLAELASLVTQTNQFDVARDQIAADKDMFRKQLQIELSSLMLRRDIFVAGVKSEAKVAMSDIRHRTVQLLVQCLSFGATFVSCVYFFSV